MTEKKKVEKKVMSPMAGWQYSAPKSRATNRNNLIRLVIRRAKEKTGWTWEEMAKYLRMGKSKSTRKCRIPGILHNADMTRIRYDKYIALCRLAGVPRAVAAVIYAQSCIPEEFAADRKSIGLTVRGLAPEHFLNPTLEEQTETYDLVKEDVRPAARLVPEVKTAADLGKIQSGVKYEYPITNLERYK